MEQRPARVSCDSLVALANSTADGSVLFAKNSDRPAAECQPLIQQPRQSHATGSRLRCTYIDIPQMAETARFIGSRPFWCWGLEHGLNEHGVAIGNHTVFSKASLDGKGLIGMDLVRLGLERGHTADEALAVITNLIEHYGQGGSGYVDKEWPYHNSFLIADRRQAFMLETSDRYWVMRRVDDIGSLSNHMTIGSDWDAISDGAIEHAIAQGWWNEDGDQRFDFAGAYRDTSMVPEVISSGRHRRTCAILDQHRGKVSVDLLKQSLRDHYGAAAPRQELTPADEEYFSVCMHADPAGTTTASMIARLPADEREPLLYWASLGSPCVGAFVPLFVDTDIPAVLTEGSEHPSNGSPWWEFKQVLTLVERDWSRYRGIARGRFDEFEGAVAERLQREAICSRTLQERTRFVAETVDQLLRRVKAVAAELQAD